MEILLGLLLSIVPLGTFIYDIQQGGFEKEFRMEMALVYDNYIKIDSSLLPLPQLQKKGSYSDLKKKIQQKQEALQVRYKTAQGVDEKTKIIEEAGIYVTEQLVNGLFPHWYGTRWSFSGYTAIPNKGEVGCSYFVSTNLLHVGFNLNRYSLAQQGPVSEAQSLALDESLILVDVGLDFEDFVPTIQEKCKEGLYFVGLGHSHVGFIYYRGTNVYFIQSSYGDAMSVVLDFAEESDILKGFGSFALVPITTNKQLMERWLTGVEIEVLKGKE